MPVSMLLLGPDSWVCMHPRGRVFQDALLSSLRTGFGHGFVASSLAHGNMNDSDLNCVVKCSQTRRRRDKHVMIETEPLLSDYCLDSKPSLVMDL